MSSAQVADDLSPFPPTQHYWAMMKRTLIAAPVVVTALTEATADVVCDWGAIAAGYTPGMLRFEFICPGVTTTVSANVQLFFVAWDELSGQSAGQISALWLPTTTRTHPVNVVWDLGGDPGPISVPGHYSLRAYVNGGTATFNCGTGGLGQKWYGRGAVYVQAGGTITANV